MASAGKTRGKEVHEQAPSRVIIAEVSPEVDSGQFPIERTEEEKAVAAAGILDEGEQIMEPAIEVPGAGVHDQAPSRVVVAEVSPEVDSGRLPIAPTVVEEEAPACILNEGEQIMEPAREAPGYGVHDQAPSRVVVAEVSPEVDSGRLPIAPTVVEEEAPACILNEVEEITEPAREAPGYGVHDQAPSRVVVAKVSPEVDSGRLPIAPTVVEEEAPACILNEVEGITEPAREAPGYGVHDQAPSRVVVAKVSPEVDSGRLPIAPTVVEEEAPACILNEVEGITEPAREAPGYGVHDQAPSRVVVAKVSPEVDSGRLPIAPTVVEEEAPACILNEVEGITEPAREAPGYGVHDQAPSRVVVAKVSPEVDSGRLPIAPTVVEEEAPACILNEVEGITEPAREAPGYGVHDQAPSRVFIAGVSPEVDGGQFPIKRTVGEEVAVAANILGDGHDVIVAVIRHRSTGATEWDEVPMILQANDRWTGRFTVTALGWHEYTIQAWVDRFLTWHRELMKKHEAGQPESHQRASGGGRAAMRGGRACQRPRCRLVAQAGPAPGGH